MGGGKVAGRAGRPEGLMVMWGQGGWWSERAM